MNFFILVPGYIQISCLTNHSRNTLYKKVSREKKLFRIRRIPMCKGSFYWTNARSNEKKKKKIVQIGKNPKCQLVTRNWFWIRIILPISQKETEKKVRLLSTKSRKCLKYFSNRAVIVIVDGFFLPHSSLRRPVRMKTYHFAMQSKLPLKQATSFLWPQIRKVCIFFFNSQTYVIVFLREIARRSS